MKTVLTVAVLAVLTPIIKVIGWWEELTMHEWGDE